MKTLTYLCYAFSFILLFSCKNYLDEKPDANLKEANNLADLDALLNNTLVMNYYNMGLGEASSDNYYVDDKTWESKGLNERQLYTWGDEIFYQQRLSNPWLACYQTIYYSNHVLARLEKITNDQAGSTHAQELKGMALFFRAFGHYRLLTLFSNAYDPQSAKTDLGIPLRLTDDFNVPSTRATVEACYQQILDDLVQAENLLPAKQINLHLPSKLAVYVLLSWIYQARGDFERSVLYAEKALNIDNILKDYKNYSPTARYPFSGFGEEIVFVAAGMSYGLLTAGLCKIDTLLYASYDLHDRRKQLYFIQNQDSSYSFKGSYSGGSRTFTGLTIADVYLNLAEGLIRLNRIDEGLKYLDTLLRHRYEEGHVPATTSMSKETALKLVLDERRKEFVMRASRWADIKRLNKIDDTSIIPMRKIGDKVFSLEKNDLRYALPLPAEIIELTGMPQNPR